MIYLFFFFKSTEIFFLFFLSIIYQRRCHRARITVDYELIMITLLIGGKNIEFKMNGNVTRDTPVAF